MLYGKAVYVLITKSFCPLLKFTENLVPLVCWNEAHSNFSDIPITQGFSNFFVLQPHLENVFSMRPING